MSDPTPAASAAFDSPYSRRYVLYAIALAASLLTLLDGRLSTPWPWINTDLVLLPVFEAFHVNTGLESGRSSRLSEWIDTNTGGVDPSWMR